MVKVAGITRIRNEEKIIDRTIDHFSTYCNEGIYVYDDCSTDNTVEISSNHEAVRKVIRGREWDTNRTRAEYTTRQRVLEEAQKGNPDWILYFDADERLDIDMNDLQMMLRSPDLMAIHMQLFDAYITEDDFKGKFISASIDIKPYNERKWFGPEYREIGFFFKNTPHLRYHLPDQREASYIGPGIVYGYVKHYGKAISIEQWEETCEYYIKHFPEPYKTKWEARKGKAIHTKSDFGNGLITWDQKKDKGFLLQEGERNDAAKEMQSEDVRKIFY